MLWAARLAALRPVGVCESVERLREFLREVEAAGGETGAGAGEVVACEVTGYSCGVISGLDDHRVACSRFWVVVLRRVVGFSVVRGETARASGVAESSDETR